MSAYTPYLNWNGLHQGDPTPGSVAGIQTIAQRYKEIADTITSTVQQLKNAGDQALAISLAVDVQRDRMTETSDILAKVENRYDTAATKLNEYATKLTGWQSTAGSLHERGVQARDKVTAASAKVDNLSQCLLNANLSFANSSSTDPFELNQLSTSQTEAKDNKQAACTAYDVASDELASITRQLTELHEKWNTGGDEAAAAIRNGIDADGQNNNFGTWLSNGWEGFAKWAEAAALIIHDIASAIAAVAGVLALVFAWVPIFGQVLAVIALVAGVIDLLAQLVNYTNGHASLGDVVLAAFGVAAGGIAKGIGAVVKGANASAKGITAATTLGSHADDVADVAVAVSSRVDDVADVVGATTQRSNSVVDVARDQARITNPLSIFHDGFIKPFTDVTDFLKGERATVLKNIGGNFVDDFQELKHWTDFTPWVSSIKGNVSPMLDDSFASYTLGQQFVASQGLALQVAQTGIDMARAPSGMFPTAGNAFSEHGFFGTEFLRSPEERSEAVINDQLTAETAK